MKRSYIYLCIRMLALCILLSGQLVAQASEYYFISVGGIAVTSENCDNITGPGITGKVQFFPETMTFKLTDATLNIINKDGINTHGISWEGVADHLNVELEGTNIINLLNDDGFEYNAILSYLPLTITGSGTLLTNSDIVTYGADMTIGGGCKVTAHAISNSTYYGKGKVLTIGGTSTEVRGYIDGFDSMKLNNGLKIISPSPGYYYSSLRYLGDDYANNAYAYIAQSDNSDRSLQLGKNIVAELGGTGPEISIPVDEGTATYNPYTQTLTLNEANLKLTGDGDYGLRSWTPFYSSGDGLVLNIVVNGSCRIWVTANYGMWLRKGITNITGDGQLVVMSDDGSAVYMEDQSVLNIIDTSVSFATQKGPAIWGEWWMMTEIVNVVHSKMTAYSPSYTTDQISAFNLLESRFQDVGALKGEYFGFDETQGGSITYYGGAHKGNVIIEPYELILYSIYIENVDVTSDNCDDPLGDGAFKFDPETATLTVMKSSDVYSIHTYYEGDLTIYVAADVTLPGNGGIINYEDTKLTITGPGKLKLSNGYISCSGTLNLIDANVEVEKGIFGQDENPKLVVRHSRVKTSSISRFSGGITLAASRISSPEGASVGADAIVDSCGDVITSGVTIEPKKLVKGDVNGDGAVDVADIAEVISVMAGSMANPYADVNNDHAVDVADIAEIISIMAAK